MILILCFLLSTVALGNAATLEEIKCDGHSQCKTPCRNWFGNIDNPLFAYHCNENHECICNAVSLNCSSDEECSRHCRPSIFDPLVENASCEQGMCACPMNIPKEDPQGNQ